MICLICRQVQIIEERVSVLLKRDEMELTVNHVPAQTCPYCGEAYVEEEIAVKLLSGAVKMSAAGEIDSVIEYSSLL
jgi:YgiT-type zinc finger domain-containing protein